MTENETISDPVKNEMNVFKEEVLKKIKELETKLMSEITNKELALNTDYQAFTSKINLLMNNNKEMVSTMVSQKLKLEKLTELESFKNKTDSMLITHEVRIKNSIDEIEKIKTKYDKIIADNLYVSGFIGNACQFRNLGEYLNFNIADVSRLKMEKDQLKKDIKELRNKFDGIMKSMVNMNDNTAKLCNNYTDTRQEYFQISLDNALKEINQKNMDMRVLMQKFQNESDQKVVELREEVNKLIKSESNLNNLINDNFYICDKTHEEIKKNMSIEDDSINNHQKLLDSLDEKTKDLQNRVKLYEHLSSKVRKLYEIIDNPQNKFSSNNLFDTAKTISQSPPPKRMRRKYSNPELIKLNSDNNNNNTNNTKISNIENNLKNPMSKKLLGKSVRNEVKKLNLNSLNNFQSFDEPNKVKEKEEKSPKSKVNLTDNLNISPSIHDNKIKLNIIIPNNNSNKNIIINNNSNKNIINNNNINSDNIIKEKEKEKEIGINTPKQTKSIMTNTIQTLPILTLGGKRNNSKHVLIKLTEIENEKSTNTNLNINNININNINNINNENRNLNTNNNILTIINNESHTHTNTNISKIKKIGNEIDQEKPGCKVVSLRLSPGSAKEDKNNLSRSKRPPKVKYDIVNSLINDYRAKLFAKAHSPDAINDINNEIVEMPKRVSQAFGRTTYTFYFKKDVMSAAYANKNFNNFGFSGPKKNYNFKTNLKTNENNTENNNKK